MRAYEWSKLSLSRKIERHVLNVLGLVGIGYIWLTLGAHRLVAWRDLNWYFTWGIFKGLLILALFPAIVLPAMWVFGQGRPPYEPKNEFYREWARIYVGRQGKGSGCVQFFIEEVKGFKIERAVYLEQPIFLLTIIFRRSFGNWRKNERCGLRLRSESELKPLLNWAGTGHIAVVGP